MMAMTPQMAGMEDDSKWKGNQSVFQILLIFLDSLAHGFLGSGSGGTRRRRSPVERGESVRPSVRPSIRPSVHLPPQAPQRLAKASQGRAQVSQSQSSLLRASLWEVWVSLWGAGEGGRDWRAEGRMDGWMCRFILLYIWKKY